MKEFLSKTLKWAEIAGVVAAALAISLKLLSQPLSSDLLMIGLLTLSTVYFLWAFSVVPPNPTSGKMGLMDILPFTLSKIMFIALSVLCVGYLFAILHLNGANEMMIIGLLTLIICLFMAMIFILGSKERMTILQSPLIRAIIALLFYFVTPLLK